MQPTPLEAETHRNIEVIWLLRHLKPDFKTIADFRRDNRNAFRHVFRENGSPSAALGPAVRGTGGSRRGIGLRLECTEPPSYHMWLADPHVISALREKRALVAALARARELIEDSHSSRIERGWVEPFRLRIVGSI